LLESQWICNDCSLKHLGRWKDGKKKPLGYCLFFKRFEMINEEKLEEKQDFSDVHILVFHVQKWHRSLNFNYWFQMRWIGKVGVEVTWVQLATTAVRCTGKMLPRKCHFHLLYHVAMPSELLDQSYSFKYHIATPLNCSTNQILSNTQTDNFSFLICRYNITLI